MNSLRILEDDQLKSLRYWLMRQRYSEVETIDWGIFLKDRGKTSACILCESDYQAWAAELIALGILIRREDGYLDQIGKHY